MNTFHDLLIELNACEDAVRWAGDMTIEEVVKTCHRGDWMLWLAARIQIDHRKLTLAKAYCVNTVRHMMKDERSIKAVDTAIAYGEGEETEQDLKQVADAANAAYAYAAYAYADSADAAAYYAAAAAYAAYAAADAAADAAAYYAAAAAYYAAAAAAYAAYADAAYAKKKNQLQTAQICREYIGQDIIDKVNEALK